VLATLKQLAHLVTPNPGVAPSPTKEDRHP
jgi:hypothetical protein